MLKPPIVSNFQARDDFAAQPLNLIDRKGRCAHRVGQHIQQRRQVFRQTFAAKAGTVNAAAKAQTRADAFQRFMQHIELAMLSAAHQ